MERLIFGDSGGAESENRTHFCSYAPVDLILGSNKRLQIGQIALSFESSTQTYEAIRLPYSISKKGEFSTPPKNKKTMRIITLYFRISNMIDSKQIKFHHTPLNPNLPGEGGKFTPQLESLKLRPKGAI